MGGAGWEPAALEQEEESLVQRLLHLQPQPAEVAETAAAVADKQRWYADAYAFLRDHGGQHWWCQHGDVTAGECLLARGAMPPHMQDQLDGQSWPAASGAAATAWRAGMARMHCLDPPWTGIRRLFCA